VKEGYEVHPHGQLISALTLAPYHPFQVHETHIAGFVILYAAYNRITAAINVHVPNVRLLRPVTCFGTAGGGSMDVGLYTREVKCRVE
jgi:hypothetical protein